MEDIDVSECCYLINYDPPKGQGNWCGAIHKGACKIYSKDCKYNENCYYKQLKRLEQENKQLKEEIEELKDVCNYCVMHTYNSALIDIKNITDARCDKCEYGKDGITCEYSDCGEAKLHLISKVIEETIDYE